MKKYSVLFFVAAYACMISTITAQAAMKIKGSDVLINGDSFFALSGQIKTDLEKLARADGVIGTSESFRNAAVSGAMIAGITNQYSSANPKPVYVIMDGGGNNVLLTTCPTPPTTDCAAIKTAISGVQPLLDKMAAGGTKKVLWMRYAEPGGSQAAVIKAKLDVLMPEIEKICRKSTNPKVMWYDLRPAWGDKGITGSYSTDGLHPTPEGAQATADAFWKAIKDSNFFDVQTPVHPYQIVKISPSAFLGQVVSSNNIFLSLFLAQPTTITMRITTALGRTVVTTAKQEQISGFRTIRFPLGAIAPGVYCLDVQTGQGSERSSLLVR